MLDEHDKKLMLSAMLTRVGLFFAEVELATRPARSTSNDCACLWPAGVSSVRRDRHAQLCGVSGYAERIAWSQHWEVYPSGLPSFLNCTEHFVEDRLCYELKRELFDQRA